LNRTRSVIRCSKIAACPFYAWRLFLQLKFIVINDVSDTKLNKETNLYWQTGLGQCTRGHFTKSWWMQVWTPLNLGHIYMLYQSTPSWNYCLEVLYLHHSVLQWRSSPWSHKQDMGVQIKKKKKLRSCL
jgi:hypothetical protein